MHKMHRKYHLKSLQLRHGIDKDLFDMKSESRGSSMQPSSIKHEPSIMQPLANQRDCSFVYYNQAIYIGLLRFRLMGRLHSSVGLVVCSWIFILNHALLRFWTNTSRASDRFFFDPDLVRIAGFSPCAPDSWPVCKLLESRRPCRPVLSLIRNLASLFRGSPGRNKAVLLFGNRCPHISYR